MGLFRRGLKEVHHGAMIADPADPADPARTRAETHAEAGAEAGAAAGTERRRAALGTAVFAVGPIVVAGVVPWRLTRWKVNRPVPGGVPARFLGIAMIGAGAAVLAEAFVSFALEGLGTPAPFAPPRRLVLGGMYRFVRNPMYLAIGSAIAGQGLLLGQRKLLWMVAAGAIPVNLFVRLYEEPALKRQFGAEFAGYARNVPRWIPRLRPWTPSGPKTVAPHATRP